MNLIVSNIIVGQPLLRWVEAVAQDKTSVNTFSNMLRLQTESTDLGRFRWNKFVKKISTL